MNSNSFGNLFKITTWGESHGKAIGVVIDGCPSGLTLNEEEIQQELFLRMPGRNAFMSSRSEKDSAEIYSGIFEGKTTGTPISIIIFNRDVDSSSYDCIQHLLRPGHANYTYLQKYGIFDFRGGGRASGRETACRVAAGAVAKKILKHFGITLIAYVKEIAHIQSKDPDASNLAMLKESILKNPLFCPDAQASVLMMQCIERSKQEGDSVGGVVEAMALSLPAGLGDPVYEKLEASLAKAMLSLPGSKGFEIGSGFEAAKMRGSEHNDLFDLNEKNQVITRTNNAGGTLGGISTGMPLVFRVAFKPPSSIGKTQETVSLDKEISHLKLPQGSRHDPCLAIRAVPVVEAMTACVLVDALLAHRSTQL